MPTAIVSNELDYETFEILDTTEYMKKTINVWESLNFCFDAASIGFIQNNEQIDIISDYLKSLNQKNPLGVIVHDPIMADDGKLYSGIDSGRVEVMRRMCANADVITPNLTEAEFLADYKAGCSEITKDEVRSLSMKLYELSGATSVITSANVSGKSCVAVFDGRELKIIEYEQIDAKIVGTGDLFTALLFSKLIFNQDMIAAVNYAVKQTGHLIEQSSDVTDSCVGVPIHRYLKDL